MSRQAYYKSIRKEITAGLSQELALQMVSSIRRQMPRIGGKKLYHMIKGDLDEMGLAMGRDRFFALLRENRLLVKRKKSYTRTTDSFHRFRVHRNLIRELDIAGPDRVYVSDITYIRLRGKRFAYLFLITDVYSRKIVGWHLAKDLSITGALTALKMALRQCRDTTGLIHHSDRGIQYCSKEYVGLLKKSRARISMTEENHCYENSVAERVNGILKDEFLIDNGFDSIKVAARAIEQAIGTYNTVRPHWSLDLLTPETVHRAA